MMKSLYWFVFLIVLVGYCTATSELNYTELREKQAAEGDLSSHLLYVPDVDILNASEDLAPKLSDGGHESTKYEIPIGLYTTSFELRSPMNFYGVHPSTHEEIVGSGLEYHTAQYDVFSLYCGEGNSDGVTRYLEIAILKYIGPVKFSATYPYSFYSNRMFQVPSNWESYSPNAFTIDGKQGIKEWAAKWSKKDKLIKSMSGYRYNLDKTIFIAIHLSGWDEAKDVSLFEETLHISKTS